MRPTVSVLIPILLIVATEAFAAPRTIVAHRGASGYLPEHTLPAAAYAHALGADFVEPDVVLTKDGVPVVLHDIHLEATTDVQTKFPDRKRADGRWYAIDFSMDEVRTLSVHERRDLKTGKAVFPNRFPEGTAILRVPTLEEYILLVQGLNKSTGKDVGLYPELKSPAFHAREGKDIGKTVLALLAAHGYADKSSNVIVQCFDPQALKVLRPTTKLRLVQLIADNSWGESDADYKAMLTEAGLKEIATYADGIGPWIPQVLAINKEKKTAKPTELVKWAHAAGLIVHPYTIRVEDVPPGVTLEQLHDLLFVAAKIDGVFTDFTDKTLAYLQKRQMR